jgi:predicted alpha/beta-hydrolase family hydrolase
MLFLQGTRDELARLDRLQPLVERLGSRATLHLFEHADHSFHVPARSGRNDAQVMEELLETMATWIDTVLDG